MRILVIVGLVGILVFVWILLRRVARKQQQDYIARYRFHNGITQKLQRLHPQLDATQLDLVFQGLRDYFHICNRANGKMVSMPSQVVDDAWHEFILFTVLYERFCQQALGRFLHHTPAAAMSSPTKAEQGIRRAWRLACAKEGINPKQPQRLPLLFALDAQLQIPNGFKYALNCQDRNAPGFGSGYCATHIGCASGCGGSSGADSSGGDSCGDGNGADGCSCGGSSCGGGGCGGGGD